MLHPQEGGQIALLSGKKQNAPPNVSRTGKENLPDSCRAPLLVWKRQGREAAGPGGMASWGVALHGRPGRAEFWGLLMPDGALTETWIP